FAERLDANDPAAATVDGAIDAGERPRAHQIQNLVFAVEIPALFTLQQAFHLVISEQLFAEEQSHHRVERNLAGAKLSPKGLDLARVQNASIANPLDQLVRANRRHDRAADRRTARGNGNSAGFRSGG